MDNQVHNAIVSFIWGIADDCLRDVYVRGKYRDVILPMTVIRRLDAMLEDTKPAVLNMKKMMDDAGITNQWPALCNAAGQAFCNASPFLLKDLTSRAKKQTLKADFEAYLDGFSPNVQEILEKFKFRNVQILSRLNRCHPMRHDTFVLDFANKPAMIEQSFSRYYRTTLLSGETDPNKLYDFIATMEEYQVYSTAHIEQLVDLYLNGAERDRLDPILDACTAVYKNLDTEEQIKFKSSAKAFCRTYGFLGAILPYGDADWEKLSIFLNLLIPKLPSPRDDDFSEGILDVIDLDSYRLEAQESMSIKLEDADAEVAPVPAGSAGHIVNPEMDLLSIILNDFNDMFGNIDWKEPDNVRRQIIAIPDMVAKDEKYQNAMKNSDKQNARMESERALQQVIFSVMADNMELFKQFQDNPSFKKWLSDMVFNMTYEPNAGSKIVKYPEPKPTMSMVAEDTVPYGDKK